MPLIQALGRQGQAGLEFGIRVVYGMGSRIARDTQKNPVSKNENNKLDHII